MSHAIIWFCLASAAAVVSLGVVRLVAWSSAQRLRRLDAEYRAFAMIANAKRDAAVARARVFAEWERDTFCGAFPDRAARDASLARRQMRWDPELERVVCALETQWAVRS